MAVQLNETVSFASEGLRPVSYRQWSLIVVALPACSARLSGLNELASKHLC